ncbi:MAG: hypothetical protein JNK02_05705 [Planctomycetes bacterium]|nr:hypothetical protein [Planctomycetota bacterium]
MSSRRLALPLALLALAAVAPAQILAIQHKPRASAGASSARAPSEDAVRAFALSFEDALRRGAREEAFALFDHEALLERASKGVPATVAVRRHFLQGAHAAWNGDAGPVGAALGAAARGGHVRWLASGERDGERSVTFRIVRSDAAAPEYLELLLLRRGERGATCADVISSTDGVSHARVLRRWLLALVADAGRKLSERIAGEDRAFALAGRTFEAIDLSFEAGRCADALAAWSTLDPALARDPSVVLTRLRAALAAGSATFDAALAEARATGGVQTPVELLAVDVATATNRPEHALLALDRLASAGPADPFLDALRGNVLRELGRGDAARAACRRALEADPELEEGWWTLLALEIESRRHEDALSVIRAMDARFEIDWRAVAQSPAYRAFLDSKPGARWRATVATKR